MSLTPNVPRRISVWRLGVVDALGPLIVYLVLMVMAYVVESPRFFRSVSPDPFSRDNLIAVSMAAMTGVFLVGMAWISARDQLWGAALSGASRLTLTWSSYVGDRRAAALFVAHGVRNLSLGGLLVAHHRVRVAGLRCMWASHRVRPPPWDRPRGSRVGLCCRTPAGTGRGCWADRVVGCFGAL